MKTTEAKVTGTTHHTHQEQNNHPFFQFENQQSFFSDQNSSSFFSENPSAASVAPVQAKLTIGQPGDPYEVEADQMADKVVQRLEENPVPEIQRQCEDCENEKIQSKEEEQEVQDQEVAEQEIKTENTDNLISKELQARTEIETVRKNTSENSLIKQVENNSPANVQSKCEECEQEEKENEEETEVQRKSLYDKDTLDKEKPDEFMAGRSWEEEQADKVIMFKSIPSLQKSGSTGATDETSVRNRIEKIAKEELAQTVEAKRSDGTGRRVGYERLLEYFDLAAPGEWPEEVIQYVKYGEGHFPHWCGIFSIYVIKKAGIDVGDWKKGVGVSQFNTLEQTDDPQKGDIGYIHEPYQHHALIIEVNGDIIKSIDGNSGPFSSVLERTRRRADYTLFMTPFTGREKYIQKKEAQSDTQENEISLENELNNTAGNGTPLDSNTQTKMESAFNAEFGNVRIHDNSKANELNDKLNAQAFTHGNDIYFNQGKYNPETSAGKHLLAHELTHTMQQGASLNKNQDIQKQDVVFNEDDVDEILADSVVKPGDDEYRQPFLGTTIMKYKGNNYLFLTESQRYVRSQGIGSTYNYGRTFFGAGNFAVIFGYVDDSSKKPTYYAVPLKTSIPLSELDPQQTDDGEQIYNGEVFAKAGDEHAIMGIFFDQGNFVASHTPQLNRHIRQQIQEEIQDGLAGMNVGLVKEEIFEKIDVLIKAGKLQQAAEQLALLAEPAFLLLPWEKKHEYIQVLVDTWTYQAQEKAIVEIIKSTQSLSELKAIVEILENNDLFNQLIDDLDYEKWSFFGVIGKKFGVIEPMDLPSFLKLLNGFGLGPVQADSNDDLLDEIKVMWDSFLGFIVGAWDSIVMLLTEPDKVIKGIGGLIKMVYMLNLATNTTIELIAEILGLNDVKKAQKDAKLYMDNLFRMMSTKVKEMLAGVKITGKEKEFGRRLRWILIWEVLSMFIGIGEIKAALTAAKLASKTLSFTRILRVLNILEESADAAKYLKKFEDLAKVLRKGSEFLSSNNKALQFISHLSDNDIKRIKEALDALGETELTSLNQLGDLGVEIQKKVDALSIISKKAGGLTDEMTAAFRHLSDNIDKTDELVDMMKLVPSGEGALFAKAILTAPGRPIEYYKILAQSKKNMETLIDIGVRNMDRIIVVAGGDADEVTKYIQAIEELRKSFPKGTQAAQFRRFLDNIEPVSLETYEILIKNPTLRDALLDNPLAAKIMKRCASPCFPPHATDDHVQKIAALAQGKSNDDLRKMQEFIYLNRDNLDDAIKRLEKNFKGTLDKEILKTFDEILASPGWKEAPLYNSLVGKLDELGISPSHFQDIIENAKKFESELFIAHLNNALASIQKSPPMSNFSELMYGLASKNDEVYQSARFLMERIHTAPKRGLGKNQADKILSRFSLDDLVAVRRGYPFDPLTNNNKVSSLANALDGILSKTDESGEQILKLIDLAGPKATKGTPDPDVERLAVIMDGMPINEKHSFDAIQEAINRQNKIADELAELGDEIAEGMFKGLDDIEVDANGRRLVMEHFDNSGSRIIAYFTEQQLLKGIVRNILDGGSDINFARWRKVEEAIRKTDMPDSIKNNIIGRYWEEVNEASHIARGRKIHIDLFPQLDVRIPGSEKGARIDMGIIENITTEGDVVKITLKLEEYKTGGAVLSDAQKLVQAEVAKAIKENRPVNLDFSWPEGVVPVGKKVEVTVPQQMNPVKPE